MNMFSDLICRLRAIIRRRAVEQELEDEFAFHLEQETAKHISRGISAPEASRRARLALQGPEQAKENCRDARGVAFCDSAIQDVRYAMRQMRRAPAFTLAAVLIIALGIGANTAIFSLLDVVVLRTLPVRDPGHLIVPAWHAKATPHPFDYSDFESCFSNTGAGPEDKCSFSYPFLTMLESNHEIFSDVTAFAGPMQLSMSADGAATIADSLVVSGSFFQTLATKPALGRTFSRQDDSADAAATVVLSHALWRKDFGSDPKVIGSTIRLNTVPFSVIGVAEPSFKGLSPGRDCALWIPIHAVDKLGISWVSTRPGDDHHFWLKIVGRLQPGVTTARAKAVLTALARDEMVERTKVLPRDSDLTVDVASADHALTGIRDMLARPLYILMGGVGLILFITCANVAGLMTARSAARQREIAIRLTVGAGRPRIMRQLLTESILLALLGGLMGFVFAQVGIRSLTAIFWWVHLDAEPDWQILLFTAAISLGAGLCFGVVPAVFGTKDGTQERATLYHAMSPSARRQWFSRSLIVAQVAVATVMLAGSGLLVRTLINLKNVSLGFNAQNLLLFGIDPASQHYQEAQIRTLYRNLRQRMAALPGVTAVTYSSDALLSSSSSSSGYQLEGGPHIHVNLLDVGPNFFETMDIPMLSGRGFTPAEFAAKRPVALVNKTFARKYGSGRNPLGLHFSESAKSPRYEIVGVVSDAKYSSVRAEIEPTAYFPFQAGAAHFEIRSERNASAIAPEVSKILHDLAPDVPVMNMLTQTEQIDDTLVIERLLARISAAFGVLALTLACIGLYGLLSYDVTRRTREIGIRMAVGAMPYRLKLGVLGETFVIVILGLAFGIPAATFSTRALAAMLYGIGTNDAATFSGIAVVLLIVSGIAGYLPARRAALVDPMVALRSE